MYRYLCASQAQPPDNFYTTCMSRKKVNLSRPSLLGPIGLHCLNCDKQCQILKNCINNITSSCKHVIVQSITVCNSQAYSKFSDVTLKHEVSTVVRYRHRPL